MPTIRMNDHLVCYDIRDRRRLYRVCRCMRKWGVRLQYSVFYCQLTPSLRKALVGELNALIDEGEDDVRIYSMQFNSRIRFQGRAPLPEGVYINGLQFERDENDS